MTREDVIRMARRAGAVFPGDGSYHTFERIEDLEHFAFLVAAAEREACAKACDEASLRFHGLWEKFEYSEDQSMSIAASQCAAAIRARSKA